MNCNAPAFEWIVEIAKLRDCEDTTSSVESANERVIESKFEEINI